MIIMIEYSKAKLARAARKHGLKFVILHGSYATERIHKGSDLDIAVLGKQELTSDGELQLYSEFAEIFGDNPRRELDLKTLHKVDSLFRYEVVREGLLLYGNPTEYEQFKAVGYRTYEDARPLRELERMLSEKYQRHLNAISSGYA